MIRLFTGLSLPPDICDRLHLLQGGIPGARWTPTENFHLTLVFIGEVDEETAADVDDMLAKIRSPAFSFDIKGTGSFAQGDDPRVLWAGVEAPPALAGLREKIAQGLDRLRLPFEKRKYAPHVTLARFRHPDELKIADFMQAHNLLSCPGIAADSFHLYESRLTKSGPAYDILRSYPLLAAH